MGILLVFLFVPFVLLTIPILLVDLIYIMIIAFFCGPFILYGDDMKWYIYLLWPFISVLGLFVGFYAGLHYELSLLSALYNDYWRIIGVSLCEYKTPQFIPVDNRIKWFSDNLLNMYEKVNVPMYHELSNSDSFLLILFFSLWLSKILGLLILPNCSIINTILKDGILRVCRVSRNQKSQNWSL